MSSDRTTPGGYRRPDRVRPEFSSAFWKIERARQHVKAFTDKSREWCGGDGYELRTERKADSREKEVRIHHPGLPVLWRLLIGDAVQNLRSALDNAVFGMAEARGSLTEKQAGEIAFPIYGAQPLPDKRAEQMMRNVPVEVRDFIKSIQPHVDEDMDYRRHFLWLLRAMSNRDKHRAMSLAAIQTSQIRASAPEGMSHLGVEWLHTVAPRTRLDNETEVATYLPLESVEGDVKIELALDVVFDDPGPTQGMAAIQTLQWIGTTVEVHVIQEIAARYEAAITA